MLPSDDEVDHEAVEDMEAFDSLPFRLRQFITNTPIGMDTPTVKELYEKKKDQCWADDDDPVTMTIVVLQVYMRQQGVQNLDPIRAKSGSKRRRS